MIIPPFILALIFMMIRRLYANKSLQEMKISKKIWITFLFSLIPIMIIRTAFSSLLLLQMCKQMQGWPLILRLTAGEYGDKTWDAVWDSKVSIVSDGWIVEMKIPYFSLGFQKKMCRIGVCNFSGL